MFHVFRISMICSQSMVVSTIWRFILCRRIVSNRKIFYFIAIVDAIWCLENIVVFLNEGSIWQQIILIPTQQPIVYRYPLKIANILHKPLLDKVIKPLIHCFCHFWMCLKKKKEEAKYII